MQSRCGLGLYSRGILVLVSGFETRYLIVCIASRYLMRDPLSEGYRHAKCPRAEEVPIPAYSDLIDHGYLNHGKCE